MKSDKEKVLLKFPQAFCVKSNDGSGYIVWPAYKTQPRGFEQAAIGVGSTAHNAWHEALKNSERVLSETDSATAKARIKESVLNCETAKIRANMAASAITNIRKLKL